ncbi:hypothetical protein AMELA_G00113710, partial [Ameiurus melas]
KHFSVCLFCLSSGPIGGAKPHSAPLHYRSRSLVTAQRGSRLLSRHVRTIVRFVLSVSCALIIQLWQQRDPWKCDVEDTWLLATFLLKPNPAVRDHCFQT